MKTPHGTARLLRRKDMGKFKQAQNERAALLRCSTISYNLAPRRLGMRALPTSRVLTLTAGDGFTRIREYEVNSDLPANGACEYRLLIVNHGLFEHRKALDWLSART